MKRLHFLTWLLAFVMMCGGLWAQTEPAQTESMGQSYATWKKQRQAAAAKEQQSVVRQQSVGRQQSVVRQQRVGRQQTQSLKKQITYPVRPWTSANLTRHWEKHGAEFPEYHSEKEYGDGALAFFSYPPNGTLFKSNGSGDRLYYHPSSNTFGVTTSSGGPKTLFRPTAGINYWNRQ